MTDTDFRALVADGMNFLHNTLPLSDPVGVVREEARVMLLAIAAQETGWTQRRQVGGGPARSYWQFELGGGVAGVLAQQPDRIKRVCQRLDIPVAPSAIFEAMAWNDYLAIAMARLLLWTDPAPLPAIGQADAAWAYYLRLWRPGKPRPDDWAASYARAQG
jgi:hypothetical protein